MIRGTGVAGLVLVLCAAGGARADERDDFFESRIRPVLVSQCVGCHGAIKASGQLRLDSRDGLLKGGESGPAVDPGKPETSLLIRAIARHEDVSAMPPDKDKALRGDQIAAFRDWVRAGVHWPARTSPLEPVRHWAFQPVLPAAAPPVTDQAWCRTSIDRWIRARQEQAGVAPLPSADRSTWIRRVTFDLTGLPPTPEETNAFVQDSRPDAFEAVVERLLQSPHYGEHWGRHWLDLVRYADTAGENSDHPLPHAWRYRNWVIRAFQQNKPFDEFVREQIAGDLLAAANPDQNYADRVIATGYLAIARRFGHDIDKDMHLTYEDTIDTLGKSILGLTIACARCHDHKFDPITARDYYGLYGILESTRFAFPGCEPQQQPRDLVPLLPPEEFARKIQPLLQQATELDESIRRASENLADQVQKFKAQSATQGVILSRGEMADSGAAEITAAETTEGIASPQVAVRRGDLIRLLITPRGNHGADTTRVDFAIHEVGGAGRQWSVADLIDGFEVHPRADRDGNPAVWSYQDARDGYAFLPEFLGALEGRSELKAWRNGDTPAIVVNTSSEPVRVWTTLPARTFFMHPGPGGPVALAWVAPLDGAVTITGRVADAHPGGDGVGWIVEKIPVSPIPQAVTMTQMLATVADLTRQRTQRAELTPKLVVPVGYAVVEGRPHNARIHKRGEPDDPGDEVPRKFLDVLGGQTLTDPAASGRRELAEWLTSSSNPLTARVFVNRVWQWHFGRGLVATPNDFGTRGVPPTHPELLDHLAHEFLASGWNLNELHRRIVLSATYRTMSGPDPGSDLYASFPRHRLTAEELRDALLAVSGQLDVQPGEAHPFPPESTWGFTQHGPFAAEYETFRRSVYVMQKRNRRTRFFALFDGPDPNASTPVRDETIVPTQALFFLNDPFLHASAEKLAQRIAAADSDEARVVLAHRLLFGRVPTEAQRAEDLEIVRETSWPAYCRVLLCSNEFLFVD